MSKKDKNRRDILKIAGALTGTIIGGSGIGSAKSSYHPGERTHQKKQIWVEDGELKYDIDRRQLGSFKYNKTVAAIEDFNQAIEAGHLRIEKAGTASTQGGHEATESTTVAVHADPSAMTGSDE